jgi:hypothetical protein
MHFEPKIQQLRDALDGQDGVELRDALGGYDLSDCGDALGG